MANPPLPPCAKFTAFVIIFCIALPCVIYINTKPEITLQNFYVPYLNNNINLTAANTSASTVYYFDLTLKNLESHKGVCYDPVDITFSYGANQRVVIGNYTHKSFYQGHGKTAKMRDFMWPGGDVAWLESAMKEIVNGSTATFTVDVFTKVKFKYMLSYSNTRRLVVRHKFEVDGSGKAVRGKNHLVLKSAALPRKMLLLDLFT